MNLGYDYMNPKIYFRNDNLVYKEAPQCVWLIREVKVGIKQEAEFLRWRNRVKWDILAKSAINSIARKI